MHVFADHQAAYGEKQPQHVYSIRFEAQQPWRAAQDARENNLAIYVDLFEPYLEPRPVADATPAPTPG